MPPGIVSTSTSQSAGRSGSTVMLGIVVPPVPSSSGRSGSTESPGIVAPSVRTARTEMDLPFRTEACRIWIALAASSAVENTTKPHPVERPMPTPPLTFDETTVPACRKWSFKARQEVLKERPSTLHRRLLLLLPVPAPSSPPPR